MYSLNALTLANSLQIKFLGETFESRNMSEYRNDQSLSASNFYNQGIMLSQIINQVRKHCYFGNVETEHLNYQGIHAKLV